MSYRVLGLDPYSKHMSLPVLRAIHKLVEDGAVVAGPKPTDDPSLADDQAEFSKLNDELFGDGTGVHKVGKGTVYAGQNLGDVFEAMNVAPDFDYTKPDRRLDSALRSSQDSPNGDLYFVDNRSDHGAAGGCDLPRDRQGAGTVACGDRQVGACSFKIADGRTTVPLNLEPWGTVFVVFRKPTKETSLTLPAEDETKLATVDGPWKVSFQPDRGAPPSITLDKLASWSDNPDPGVKYFSGTGTYTKTIDAPAAWFKTRRARLDRSGRCEEPGRSHGEWQIAGHRVACAVSRGCDRRAEARSKRSHDQVTNAWVNRLIGDQQPDAVKITFADVKPYKADSPLLPSGLLGPVTLNSITRK